MPTFTHDHIRFFYRDTGAGRPFFFQHGLGADSSQTFGIFTPPPGIRLLSFDCRAHGETQPLGEPEKIRLATFADDLGAFMDHLGIERAIIGGISMGAAITLNFTLRHPARVLGLVQSRPAWLDAPCPWNVKMFSLVAGLVRQHGAKRGQELFKQTEEFRETLENWPDVANSLALQFEHPRIEESAFKLEQLIKDVPCRDRRDWAKIQVPTLVLANALDPIHPYEYAEVIASLIPGAELREITSKSVSLERHNADTQRWLGEFLQRHFGS